MTNYPKLSLVVTTVGRPADFGRLLDSIEASPVASDIELVLIDQSQSTECIQLLRRRPPPGPWKTGTSGRGASVGRNVGLAIATADLVAFPNDNSWFANDTLPLVLRHFADQPNVAGLSGRLLTESGTPSLLRWHRRPRQVSRRNFMRTTICSTIVLRRAALARVGGFDERLGTGSDGWFGSGEESDLILRLLKAGFRLDYRPDITIYHRDERDAPSEPFVAKMLRYGSGHGRIWRVHRLPLAHLLYMSIRKMTGASIRLSQGKYVLARADIAYLRGVGAGWRGVPPGRHPDRQQPDIRDRSDREQPETLHRRGGKQ
jgi:GT2 family glycosyltransferase